MLSPPWLMPTAHALSHRAVSRLCTTAIPTERSLSQTRRFGNKKGQWIRPPRRPANATGGQGSNRTKEPQQHEEVQPPQKPSLAEQLFPEESKLYASQQTASREIPPLPFANLKEPPMRSPVIKKYTPEKSLRAMQLQAEMEAVGPGIAVLVLRNASPNLTEEDFRRLIPQGRHIDGWTLDQGDILKVIPWRSVADLRQEHHYYLLFSSALSAFTYQGHVTNIHRLADAHTPTSMSSPMPPPPGYITEGIELHTAIQAYALVPPGEKLELLQLRPPLPPLLQAMVRHQGIPHIVRRKDKSPFEARLTMEGPQLQPNIVRHIFMETARDRGLNWSGGENINLNIKQWEPKEKFSAQATSERARQMVKNMEAGDFNAAQETESSAKKRKPDDALKRRTPPLVYVVGFHSEKAAISFTQHWHRRPLEVPSKQQGRDHFEGDIAPIANVQLLW